LRKVAAPPISNSMQPVPWRLLAESGIMAPSL
jgi:hypothetical protein